MATRTAANPTMVGSAKDAALGVRQAAPVRVGFIVGPTGAGKTALALAIAQRLDAEIVNADSRQVYRGMDIGTAMPSAADQHRVPHHLIGVRTPGEPLDVAEFTRMAHAAIEDIAARGRRPIVVGGSGLYLRALRGGIFRGPAASLEIRARLQRVAAERGVSHLHDRLREVDPTAARRIGCNDLYRITRALEVLELTGEPISAHQARHAFSNPDYESLTVGVATDRKDLYEAINRRFDAMVAEGLVEEVRGLIAAGYRPDRPPLSTIGYKQIAAHLRGELPLDDAIELAKRESRRLAKRQMTWFRADPAIVWLDPPASAEQAERLLAEFFARP
ncbi:MAG: tRNA (adenosine(37)-N6)-dimethylallyltransferase MiaA [Candidatus Binataceae bacterium]